MEDIQYLVMDVDGTLTDGKIYIGTEGELYKAFDVKDGYAIHNILPQYGITPVIITGRTSSIVEVRAKELGVEHLYQGVEDKAACLRTVVSAQNASYEQIACIGDDENDVPMMELCGISGCPGDAVQAVKDQCNYVCIHSGGHGAVREFVEWLIKRGTV